jgi:hypothetical protein
VVAKRPGEVEENKRHFRQHPDKVLSKAPRYAGKFSTLLVADPDSSFFFPLPADNLYLPGVFDDK